MGQLSLLARINGALEDPNHNNGPSSALQRAAGTGMSAEGGQNIDWLDKQIWAIEQRREMCEMRQKHLVELRRVVGEDKAWGRDDEGDIAAGESIAEENSDHVSQGRLSYLEQELSALKKNMVEFGRDTNVTFHGERGVQPCASMDEDELRSARVPSHEQTSLALKLKDAQAALEREKHYSQQAVEAQQTAEADLRTLEDKSRDVLHDCRALQATVSELEDDQERKAKYIEVLEKKVREWEVAKGIPSPRAAADIVELEAELASYVGQSRRMTELELELSELRTQNENLEQSNKETLGRVIELEQQLGEARALVERHGNELKVHQDAKQQLERQVSKRSITEAEFEGLRSQNSKLEQHLSESRRKEAHHLALSDQHRARHENLEEQLRKVQSSEESAQRQSREHLKRIADH